MINDVRSQTGTESVDFSSDVSSDVSSRAHGAVHGAFNFAYHEIARDKHVVRVDVLEQLKANISQLEELHGRLRFMMGEVRSLLKRG